MSAVDWERGVALLHETARKWDAIQDGPKGVTIETRALELRGRERGRFWQQRFYFDAADRRVTLRFRWRDPESRTYPGTVRDIEIVGQSKDTPWENLLMLAKALEEVRLFHSRGHARAAYNLLNQMYPPGVASSGPERIVYRDRVVYRDRRDDPDSPYVVIGVREDAPLSVCEAAYRAHLLEERAHPDVGGTHEGAKKLNLAIEEIRRQKQGGRAS